MSGPSAPEQPVQIGLPTVEQRLQTMKNLTEHFEVPIPERFNNDPHFWYLTTRDYWTQRKRIPETLELKIDRKTNLGNIRKLAIINAAEHASKYALLENEAATDNLTGAFNRGALDKYLLHFLGNRHRGVTDAIIMLDLDHLREINNLYGHVVGDHALEEFVKLIQKKIRGVDFFARYGGEEFVLVMPEIDTSTDNWQEKFLQRIDQLRDAVEKNIASLAGERSEITIKKPITSSFGVMFVDDTLTVKNLDELENEVYKVADGYLYQAKDARRNCVVGPDGVFTPPSPNEPNQPH